MTVVNDHLRLPSIFDPSAPAYKDWLHLNVFDHASGTVALINACLHGALGDPRSRAVGTALVDVPGRGWFGNLTVGALADAALGDEEIRLGSVAVVIDLESSVLEGSVRMASDGLLASVRGRPVITPITVPGPVMFGTGWLGWYALPRLELAGEIKVLGRSLPLDEASGYFDHTWGRWHWGDDLGWDWGSFLAQGNGPTIVLSRVTDKAHRVVGTSRLEVRVGSRSRRFVGSSIVVESEGTLDALPLRLPGALAALHSDRALPRLPSRIRVTAHDGGDDVEVDFAVRNAAQLVLADPSSRGYGFLHELPGTFECAGRLSGHAFAGSGLGIVETAE